MEQKRGATRRRVLKFGSIEFGGGVILVVHISQISSDEIGIEDDANPLFPPPNDAAMSSEVVCGDDKVKYRGNPNLALNLQGGAGVRKISNETIDSRTVEGN
jgi:hypothetical protein